MKKQKVEKYRNLIHSKECLQEEKFHNVPKRKTNNLFAIKAWILRDIEFGA